MDKVQVIKAKPKGICAAMDCTTILSRYNSDTYCGVHSQPDFNVGTYLPPRVTNTHLHNDRKFMG